MKKLVIGILAHVDAGKTTLVESIMYSAGKIKKLGRVDHKNAFLDTYELERSRGITIFSKQAILKGKDLELTLLDTPGHIDFSAEMERTLQVLDYAILVVSGRDGVQGHTETLWKLLKAYQIPTFLFLNKMDMEETNKELLIKEIKEGLSDRCLDFTLNYNSEEFMESLALTDELLLDQYISSGKIKRKDIADLIKKRRIFPCYFGSALKNQGIDFFLKGIEEFVTKTHYSKEFGARIYKIGRDDKGNRLTFMKITGGSLSVKMSLTNGNIRSNNGHKDKSNRNFVDEDLEIWEEKVDQIRIYSGAKYEVVEKVEAGSVCALVGLSRTFPGEGLGIENRRKKPVLESVFNYNIVPPADCNIYELLLNLRQLEEEDPQLQVVWNEKLKEIYLKLMGEIQIEILKKIILERFNIEVEFGPGNIVYKESIVEPVVGIGHFEPLGHYAEVHLLLEPGKPGSGLTFDLACSEEVLSPNWQRLVLVHLQEKEHIGVLTGSPITDMKISLIAGRGHQKHTEGGDFREATYRAVRQGLKKANSILLEPYYNFRMEIPHEMVGRAMSDIQRMFGHFNPPVTDGTITQLTGYGPVVTMRGYQREFISYTGGRGKLFFSLKGYEPCHNREEVIKEIGYDNQKDLQNPAGSIFCSKGAGFFVEWDKVEEYMHLDSGWKEEAGPNKASEKDKGSVEKRIPTYYSGSIEEDKELEDIFIRTYGPINNKINNPSHRLGYERIEKVRDKEEDKDNKWKEKNRLSKKKEVKKKYLLVDGYNIIFAWEELRNLAEDHLDAARTKLMDILTNYQGYSQYTVILVFDAYKVKGGQRNVTNYHNIHVVYTKEAETADMYIEKVTREIAHKHHVVVATSDYMEQLIIMGQGGIRISAGDLKEEILRVNEEIKEEYLDKAFYGTRKMGNNLEKKLDDMRDKKN